MSRPSVVGADHQLTVRIPSSLFERIEDQADKFGITRSAIVRLVLAEFMNDPALPERISEDLRDGMIPPSQSEMIVIRQIFGEE